TSVQLGQHLFGGAALGEVVAVLAVGADDIVGGAQRGDGAHAHRLLADAEVEEAAYFALGVGFGRRLFDPPDGEHLAVQLEEQRLLLGAGLLVTIAVHRRNITAPPVNRNVTLLRVTYGRAG